MKENDAQPAKAEPAKGHDCPRCPVCGGSSTKLVPVLGKNALLCCNPESSTADYRGKSGTSTGLCHVLLRKVRIGKQSEWVWPLNGHRFSWNLECCPECNGSVQNIGHCRRSVNKLLCSNMLYVKGDGEAVYCHAILQIRAGKYWRKTGRLRFLSEKERIARQQRAPMRQRSPFFVHSAVAVAAT